MSASFVGYKLSMFELDHSYAAVPIGSTREGKPVRAFQSHVLGEA